MNILLQLALQFFILSLIAVGGASATLPEMHRVFVDKLHLMSNDEFNNLFALSQAAPGPNVLFVGLFGLRMAGFAGASVSMLSMCGPTAVLAVVVDRIGLRHHESRFYTVLRRSLLPISIGLLMSTGALLIRASADWRTALLTAASAGILWRWRANPLILIAVGAFIGAMGWIS